jgi:uncharacterized membrane protein
VEKDRLLAFSDGVIAIIITIMVLELKVPHGADFEALQKLAPVFVSYVLSFLYVAIYWNNHHHLMHTVKRVDGAILWANMHLLFWLSLVPFTTGWMGENKFAALPVALYGFSLLMPGVSYKILQTAIIRAHGDDATLAKAVGNDTKGWASLLLYMAAIPLALIYPFAACAIYAAVALMWILPDPRIEKAIKT